MSDIEKLPVYEYLDEICEKLKNSPSRFLVLTAETAAGKSTAVPVSLLKHFSGQILMLEPRRLAVVNIASRVSELLGDVPGGLCGYTVHLEKKVSPRTRFTVLTEAVLTRMMQSDPVLEGVSVVVIDEFHERSVHSDLALAFLKEAVALRDDLFVIVMSATIQTEHLCSYLGESFTGSNKGIDSVPFVPVMKIPGRRFPVTVEYEPNLSPSRAVIKVLSESVTVNKSVPKTVPIVENRKKSDTLSVHVNACPGQDILVFLPGIAEIRRTKTELESLLIGTDLEKGTEIFVLHSSVPFDEQKKILKGHSYSNSADCAEKRRVILSSSIAETSLTVPDVGIVIDCGLSRYNIFNQSLLMDTLVTRSESMFSAQQRAGRAGRMGPGRCIRLWRQSEPRPESLSPEILRSDLNSLVLECAEWGVSSREGLSWLDVPSESAWNSAVQVLELLGCLKEGKITELGRACLFLGLNPRVACVALSGIPFGKVELSTSIAVKCALGGTVTDRMQQMYEQDLKKRVQIYARNPQVVDIFALEFTEFSTGCALLCGYPDRLAVADVENRGRYKFASGREAVCSEKGRSAYGGSLSTYIVAPEVDAGSSCARIYDWASVDEAAALSFMNSRTHSFSTAAFSSDGKLVKTEGRAYGKIILESRRSAVSEEDYSKAVCAAVKADGIEWLPLEKNSMDFLKRCGFYAENCGSGEDGFRLKLKNLALNAEEWLVPFIPRGEKVNAQSVYNALYWYLDGAKVCECVPAEITLENGRHRKLLYEKNGDKTVPVLEVIIQQVFGCFSTPRVMGVPVLMRLLSPARRPLQVTTDLENFWNGTWKEICSEMKGRYPKHNWDYTVSEGE